MTTISFMAFGLSLLVAPPFASPFSATRPSMSPRHRNSVSAVSVASRVVELSEVSTERTFLIDGAELRNLNSNSNRSLRTTVAVGADADGNRVIGILDGNGVMHRDSPAALPTSVRVDDAVATYRAFLGIAGAVPISEKVGGSDEVIVPETFRAVVMGGNDVAAFAARALAALGGDVHVVTSGSPQRARRGLRGAPVTVVKPGVGVNETGFATHIGTFDSLVDTLYDERSSHVASDDYGFEDESDFILPKSGVVDLLKSRHGCERYLSTVSESQRIVAEEGVVFGPGKTNDYVGRVEATEELTDVPVRIGELMETILKAGVTFDAGAWRKSEHAKGTDGVRGWTLADFWEQATWPRDAAASTSVRFGLPAPSEFDDDDDDDMISAPPLREGGVRDAMTSRYARGIEIGSIETADEREAAEAERRRLISGADENPYVMDVVGVRGLRERIVDDRLDCVLFLSARFCKACKTLGPQYTRLARLASETDVVFAKGEASGRLGRQLGQELEVAAVPSFLLFRKGRRFGPPLSISRLPSPELDRALELLQSGATEWDDGIATEDDEDNKNSGRWTQL